MENNLELFLAHIFGSEGGYVNDPRDPGMETKYGISKHWYPNVDIKNLALSEAKDIYEKDYWNKICGAHLNPVAAFNILDYAVNSGVYRSVRTAQLLVGVNPDGVMGPDTYTAINAIDPEKFCEDYSKRRLMFLNSLSNFEVFGQGWLNRIEGNKKFSLTLLGRVMQ